LEVLFSREEAILTCHGNTSNNVVLDETSQWLAGGGHKILIIGVGNHHCFGTSNLILYAIG
jgi:hypothetical protein